MGKDDAGTVQSSEIPFTVACDNLDGLASVIRRAGNAFTLEINHDRDDNEPTNEEVEQFVKMVGNEWTFGIQTLLIWTDSDTFIDTLGKLLLHNRFPSLQKPAFRVPSSHSVVKALFQQLENLAPKLTALDLDVSSSILPVFQYPSLLGRALSLFLKCYEPPRDPIPWAYFTNLKHLEVYQKIIDHESRLWAFLVLLHHIYPAFASAVNLFERISSHMMS